MGYKFPKIEKISEEDEFYYRKDLIGKAVFKIKNIGLPDEKGFYSLDCHTRKYGRLFFTK